jgi:hypothetical protein
MIYWKVILKKIQSFGMKTFLIKNINSFLSINKTLKKILFFFVLFNESFFLQENQFFEDKRKIIKSIKQSLLKKSFLSKHYKQYIYFVGTKISLCEWIFYQYFLGIEIPFFGQYIGPFNLI